MYRVQVLVSRTERCEDVLMMAQALEIKGFFSMLVGKRKRAKTGKIISDRVHFHNWVASDPHRMRYVPCLGSGMVLFVTAVLQINTLLRVWGASRSRRLVVAHKHARHRKVILSTELLTPPLQMGSAKRSAHRR